MPGVEGASVDAQGWVGEPDDELAREHRIGANRTIDDDPDEPCEL